MNTRDTPTAAEWYKIIEAVEPGAMRRLFNDFTKDTFDKACRDWQWDDAGTPELDDGMCISPILLAAKRSPDWLYDLDTRVCRFIQAWYL